MSAPSLYWPWKASRLIPDCEGIRGGATLGVSSVAACGMPRTLLSILLLLTLALLIAATANYGIASSQSGNGKYDTDGDGLIEVSNLEQLDAIRYDLDGDGKADDDSGVEAYASAFPGTVCNNDCNGYELAGPLDFNDADSYASGEVREEWTTGEGWLPIQSGKVWILFAENPFSATFDGNGHAIANLYVNRTAPPEEPPPVGLFGYTGYSVVIRDTGIANARVAGLENVGGLAGRNMGEIRDSHATVSMSGNGHHTGGLVGENEGVISGSHAAVSMSCGGNGRFTGGLAGWNGGTISGSYATGSVSWEPALLAGLPGPWDLTA